MVPRRPCQEENIIPDVCQANARLTRCQGFSLAWEASRPSRACVVCDILRCLAWIYNRRAPCPYIPYYNRAAALTCIASRRGAGIWYVLEVLRSCDTLQRGAGGIIAACVGLVSAAVEWDKSQEKPL